MIVCFVAELSSFQVRFSLCSFEVVFPLEMYENMCVKQINDIAYFLRYMIGSVLRTYPSLYMSCGKAT